MKITALIFLGAGLGGVLRFWTCNGIVMLLGRQFPFATLFVNVSGSFLMGLLFILLFDYIEALAPELRAFLLIGLLGGYTTFSAFSLETLHLLENGQLTHAILNVVSSVVLCISAALLGAMGAGAILKTV